MNCKIVVYTDGSAKGNGKKDAIGGIGVFFPLGEYNNISDETIHALSKSKLFYTKVTNNLSELTAILKALVTVKEYLDKDVKNKVIVKTDSNYAINCVTKWYINWEKNNWMTASKKPVSNELLLKEIVNKFIKIYPSQILFVHVRSHTKMPSETSNEFADWYGNFQADFLATNFDK